jgi:hypothetical protein
MNCEGSHVLLRIDLHNCAWTVSGRRSNFLRYITIAKCTAWLRYDSMRDKNSIAWNKIKNVLNSALLLRYQIKQRFYSQPQTALITSGLGNTTKDCRLLWNMLHLKQKIANTVSTELLYTWAISQSSVLSWHMKMKSIFLETNRSLRYLPYSSNNKTCKFCNVKVLWLWSRFSPVETIWHN